MMSSPNAGSRRPLLRAAAAALLLSWGAVPAQTAYPSRPITLIVPYPAGGASDRHMRTIAELAAPHLGQPILVDNKPGASGTLGTVVMAQTAKADGYTIAQYPLGMLRVPHMQKTAWHPIHDFTFIAGIAGYTFGVVVKADSPYKTFQDYIEAARKQPGKLDYGSAGAGTSPHLLMKELSDAAGVELSHVPFKGSAELQTSLLGGHVMAASDATTWDKFVENGQMRLLVTFSDKPTKRWPSAPTAKSLGYDVVGNSPYGIVGPKDMDPVIVQKLHDAFKKAVEDPRNQAFLDQMNQDSWYRSSSDYRAWAQATYQKEKLLIERLGLAYR